MINTKIPASILQLVLITAAIGAGIANGNLATIIGIIPVIVRTYDRIVIIIGPIINGIPSIGFITIGAPNIIGSFMLNNPGKNPNLPKLFRYCDLENINITTNARVAPAPPIHTYHCKNCSVNMFGIA